MVSKKRFLKNLALRILELREGRDETQAQVAENAGMPVNNYTRSVEKKGGKNMTVYTAARVAEALGVPIGDLFVEAKPRRWPKKGRPKRRRPKAKMKNGAPPEGRAPSPRT